jgi:MoaA/NifB/PqqE/SkfB family radical SAM enzyme
MNAEIKARIGTERTPLQDVIPLSTPYLVFLDPSDLCNSTCPWCPTGSKEAAKYKKPVIMGMDLYVKIIDDLAAMPEIIKTLRLYKDGEPLLNKDLPSMIRYAKDTGRFGQIDTTTNGSLLNPRMNHRLIDSGLDKIFISVPHNYDSPYRWNVRHLYQNRERMRINVKIIGDGLSEHGKKVFMEDFGNIADEINIENLAPCWPGFEVGKVGEKGIYGQEVGPEPKVCAYLFYSLAINSDGTVSLCFLDWKRDMVIGDLKRDRFVDIWNGMRLRGARINHLTGHRCICSISCGICLQLKYGAPDNIDQYAMEILGRLK